jgi:two-component system nitrogen regulation response regulator GlnG
MSIDDDDAPLTALPVLLVDDDLLVLKSTARELRASGCAQIIALSDGREVLPKLDDERIGAVLLDLSMPHMSGQQLLEKIKASHPEIPVIVMTATSDLETAVQCMRDGAVDYLVKPVEPSRLISSVINALKVRQLEDALSSVTQMALSESGGRHAAFSQIYTQSREMLRIFRYLEQVAATEHPLLIGGESGTGKELLARAVHGISGRTGPFVAVEVAAGDDDRVCDDLFGHARGAYIAAVPTRKGMIAEAANGTLFLGDVANLGDKTQARMVGLLRDGAFRPLGGDQLVRSRARVIAATSRDLDREVEAGRFRKDLYFQLRRRVDLPALRARRADLKLLATQLLERAAAAAGKKTPRIPSELFLLLGAYHFPGNVRELESMCQSAIERHESGILSLRAFREFVARNPAPDGHAAEPSGPSSIGGVLEQLEPLPTLEEVKQALEDEALKRSGGKIAIAADLLGLARATLNARLIRRRKARARPRASGNVKP